MVMHVMTQKRNFELMASYNKWLNEQFYQLTSELPQQKRDKDQGAFFGSISGTLNHILVGDLLWLDRFSAHPANFIALQRLKEFVTPTTLDQRLFADFSKMRAARSSVDQIILSFCSELTENDLAHPLSYNNSKGKPFQKNFAALLQHFFNHQTHHRGQVSTLLYQQGVDVGVTDLLMKIPD